MEELDVLVRRMRERLTEGCSDCDVCPLATYLPDHPYCPTRAIERWLELAERYERLRAYCVSRANCDDCPIDSQCATLSPHRFLCNLSVEEVLLGILTIMSGDAGVGKPASAGDVGRAGTGDNTLGRGWFIWYSCPRCGAMGLSTHLGDSPPDCDCSVCRLFGLPGGLVDKRKEENDDE